MLYYLEIFLVLKWFYGFLKRTNKGWSRYPGTFFKRQGHHWEGITCSPWRWHSLRDGTLSKHCLPLLIGWQIQFREVNILNCKQKVAIQLLYRVTKWQMLVQYNELGHGMWHQLKLPHNFQGQPQAECIAVTQLWSDKGISASVIQGRT